MKLLIRGLAIWRTVDSVVLAANPAGRARWINNCRERCVSDRRCFELQCLLYAAIRLRVM